MLVSVLLLLLPFLRKIEFKVYEKYAAEIMFSSNCTGFFFLPILYLYYPLF